MRVLAHPLRLDGSGSIATIDQGSTMQAAQLAQAVVSTVTGERELAPDFGIPDPTGVGVSAETLLAAMAVCEPDLTLVEVEIAGAEQQDVTLTVAWEV
jgi:hypothetical protein